MSKGLDFHKEIMYTKNYNDDQSTPYINISNFKSDSSNNLQVESSRFSLKSNNNNIFVSSTSGILSFSKSIINTNIINNINNSTIMQKSSENLSLSDSNKLQNSFNLNQITRNSFFYSPSTLCNYYQKSNDFTPNRSPLIEEKLEQSNNKKSQKLKYQNNDIFNKKNYQKENNNKNSDNNNFNIEEISSHNDEYSLDCRKSLSSHRKYILEKKTPIKYAKNQLQSGDKNEKSINNNSPFSINKSYNNTENFKSEISKGVEIKNRRNLMDTFEKIGNNNEKFNIFNNRRQPTEIHLTSPELIKKKKNNTNNQNIIEKLQEDSSFLMYKDINKNAKDEKIFDNNYASKTKKIPKNDEKFNKKEWKKIVIRKIVPITKKKYNTDTLKLSKKITKELSRSNIRNRKENILKIRPSSFTKNIIININSINSINNSNICIKNSKKIQNQKEKKIVKKRIPIIEKYNNNRSTSFTKLIENNTNLILGRTANYIINKKINKKSKNNVPLILNLYTEKEKLNKNKLIPVVNSKRDNNSFIINELKELTNNCDKNYQTFSAWTRVENNLRLKLNDKKDLINDIREKTNHNIIHPILNKEEPKLNVIQNFSSYHKIKSHHVNLTETQPKYCSRNNINFYNYNRIKICTFEN